jgi:autotransporter-associated beta strand protein
VTSGTAAIQFASLDNDNGTVAGFGLNPTTANVIVVGGVNLGAGANAGTANFTLGGTGSVNSIGGAIVNGARVTANLIKSGTSTWALNGDNTYNGTTTISGGTLLINGNSSTIGLTTVQTGGTIGGSGTVGALTVQTGGFIAPGNSPDVLDVNGNYIQAGTYNAEINAVSVGNGTTGYDQINVTGTVNITGGTLATAFAAGTYAENDLLFILINDDTDAITGTFTGLAQGGQVVAFGGFDWKISYVADFAGGTFTGGNDIALRAVPEPNVAALIGAFGGILLLRRRR